MSQMKHSKTTSPSTLPVPFGPGFCRFAVTTMERAAHEGGGGRVVTVSQLPLARPPTSRPRDRSSRREREPSRGGRRRTKSNHFPPLPRTIWAPSIVLNSRLRSPARRTPDEPSPSTSASTRSAAAALGADRGPPGSDAVVAFFFLGAGAAAAAREDAKEAAAPARLVAPAPAWVELGLPLAALLDATAARCCCCCSRSVSGTLLPALVAAAAAAAVEDEAGSTAVDDEDEWGWSGEVSSEDEGCEASGCWFGTGRAEGGG